MSTYSSSRTAFGEFLREERIKRAPFLRIALVSCLMVLVGYVFLTSAFLPSQKANSFTIIAVSFSIYIGLYISVIGKSLWIERDWIDFATFLISIIFTDLIRIHLSSQFEETGWGVVHVLTGNAAIVLAFVSLLSCTRFSLFAIWSTIYMAVYVWNLANLDENIAAKGFSASVVLPVLFAALWMNWQMQKNAFSLFMARKEVSAEKQKAEELLYNILPQRVAERLRQGDQVADAFSNASVIFVDVVDSSTLARTLSPGHFIETLNRFFLPQTRSRRIRG